MTDHNGAKPPPPDSEIVFREILTSLNDSVFITDDAGCFKFVCENCGVNFGYSQEEVLAMGSIQALLGGEIFDPSALEKSGIVENIEWEVKDKKGVVHNFLITVKTVNLLCGTRLYACRDTTSRISLERALSESKNKFETLVNQTPQALFLHDLQGRILEVNETALKRYGYTKEQLISMNTADIDPDYVQREDGGLFWDHLHKKHRITFEAQHKTSDGELFPVEVSLVAIELEGEKRIIALADDISLRKRSEEEIRRTAREWQTTFDASADVIWILDRDQRIVRCNQTTEKTFGLSERDVLGKHCWEIVHQTTEPIPECPITRTLKSLSRESMDLELGEKWFRIVVDPVLNERGEFNGAVHIISDITERRALEKASREREALLATMTENYPNCYISIIEKDMTVGFTSGQEFQKQNLDPNDFVGLSLEDVFGEQAPKVKEHYEKTFQGEEREFELFVDNQHQRYRTVPLYSERGDVQRIMTVVENITERVMKDRKIHQIGERYRLIFENAQDAIFIADPDSGMLLDCNKMAEELVGLTREELRQMHQTQLHPPEKIEEYAKEFEKATKAEGIRFLEMDVVHKDGRRIPVEINSGGVIDEGGQRIHFGIFRDISERKKAELEIVNAQKRYCDIFNNSTDCIFIHDAKTGEIVDVNQKTLDVFGYSIDEIKKQNVGDLSINEPPYTAEEAFGWIQKAMSQGPQQFEWLAKNKEGQLIWFENSLIYANIAGEDRVLVFGRNINDRKIAENKLAESESRFRSYVENSPYGVFIADKTGRYLEVNQAACRITGYSEDELLSKNIPDLIPKDSRGDAIEHFTRLLENGYSSGDVPFLTKNGERRIWSVDAVKISEDRFLGFTQDVTEQILARERLRESEERFRSMAEQSTDVISLTDTSGIITYASEACRDVFGCSQEEMTGRHFTDFLHESSIELAMHHFQKIIAKNTRAKSIELLMKRKDGSSFFGELSGRLFDVADNQGALVVIRDISDRKKAEEKLRLQTLVLDQIQDRVTVTDLEGIITYVNDAEVRALGHSRDDLIGASTKKYGEDSQRGATQQEIVETTLRDGHWRGEVVNYTVDEREVIMDCRTQTVRDDSGHVIALCGIATDITKRKKAEEEQEKLKSQLLQSQKMESIGRLAGGVAHDFNNLLTAIQGFSDIVQDSLSPEDPLKKDVAEIQRAAESAAALTHQLLAFSRKQIISPRIIDLNKEIAHLEKMLRRIIGEDVDFVFKPQEKIGRVFMDPGQVSQILVNLAVNSRDAMPNGGKLDIQTRRAHYDNGICRQCNSPIKGEFIVLAISDTGVGINEETLKNIFEPFFTTKGVGKGTGLGLSTVHGIVHQNNGHINVFSTPGEGTTFEIYLPAIDEKEDISIEKKEINDLKGGETILLVEDQGIVRKMASRSLKIHGYRIMEAENGGDAFLKFEKYGHEVDLLLTDVVMPEMSGKELYERLLKINPKLKALFMSGYSEDIIEHHGILDERINFIQKPFKPKELAEKVRQVLDS